MLIHPIAIVAALFFLIVSQLTVSEQFQSGRKLLGQRLRHKIALIRSRRRASFGLLDHSTEFEAAAPPVALVETTVIPPLDIVSLSPAQVEDFVEVVAPEIPPAQNGGHRSPTRIFVVAAQCHGPLRWMEFLNCQVSELPAFVSISILFLLVVALCFTKLFSRWEPVDKTEAPTGESLEQLPPIYLSPPKILRVQSSNPGTRAPLEPISSSALPDVSPFWLVSEKEQDQPSLPSPPVLRLLDFSDLENKSQNKSSPHSSPADSGYGTTLPSAVSDIAPFAWDKSTTNPLPMIDPHLTPTGSDVTDPSGGHPEDDVDVARFDTELEDDDDGSTTVTNSTANLTDLMPRPALVSAEELAARLDSATAAPVENVRSIAEPLALDDLVKEPSQDGPTTDLPSDGPYANVGTDIQGLPMDGVSINAHPPSEPSSDSVHTTTDSAYPGDEATVETGLESKMEESEIRVGDNHDSGDVEPWSPDYVVPTIIITPPSEVDPDDFAPQLGSEDDQEGLEDSVGSGHEDGYEASDEDWDCELEYAGGYRYEPVSEATPDSPLDTAETRDDPYHSPITTSGMLWSDDEGNGPGPLPRFEKVPHVVIFDVEIDDSGTTDVVHVVEEMEVHDPPTQMVGSSDVVMTVCEEPDVKEPVFETDEEPIRDPQPCPVTPIEYTPTVRVPPPNPPRPRSPLPASRSSRPQFQPPISIKDRGEGSSKSSRTPVPQRLQFFHCCDVYKSDGRPASWENWQLKKGCIPHQTSLQVSHFMQPTDKDGANPTTRIAIDNLDAMRFRNDADGVPSYEYLAKATSFFSTRSFRCWEGRMINGVGCTFVGYATVDFDSVDEAIRMFEELQGRRFRGHTWHWRLEFVDPDDETHGGRRVTRAGLVLDSVKQALAAQLEASTRGAGGSADGRTGSVTATRPPMRVRPQLGSAGRSILAGVMENVVRERGHPEERPTESSRRALRRSYKS